MSDYELRPNVNRATQQPDYTADTGGFGFWILAAALIIAVLFAITFFAGGGGGTFEGTGEVPAVLPSSTDSAPAPSTPQPVPVGE